MSEHMHGDDLCTLDHTKADNGTSWLEVMESVPGDTTNMSSVLPGRPVGISTDGYIWLWFIFRRPDDRQWFMKRFANVWVEGPDRCQIMSYLQDWHDVNGYGLEMTTFNVEQNGLPLSESYEAYRRRAAK